MTASWRDWWDGTPPIYVSERHKALHYRGLASDIAALVRDLSPGRPPVLLDYGCGEALAADRVATSCERLLLSDGAPTVRARLQARFAAEPRIAVLSPEEVEALPDASLDIVLVNSVLQYLPEEVLAHLLALFHVKLKPAGRLVLADVIPNDVGPADDAGALLAFAAQGGFLGAALVGLVRTALSDYRKTRARLGLAHYDETELLTRLIAAGYAPRRRRPNLGHNQKRMTFVAQPNPPQIRNETETALR